MRFVILAIIGAHLTLCPFAVAADKAPDPMAQVLADIRAVNDGPWVADLITSLQSEAGYGKDTALGLLVERLYNGGKRDLAIRLLDAARRTKPDLSGRASRIHESILRYELDVEGLVAFWTDEINREVAAGYECILLPQVKLSGVRDDMITRRIVPVLVQAFRKQPGNDALFKGLIGALDKEPQQLLAVYQARLRAKPTDRNTIVALVKLARLEGQDKLVDLWEPRLDFEGDGWVLYELDKASDLRKLAQVYHEQQVVLNDKCGRQAVFFASEP
jgi:hypothetical protein